VAVSSLDTRTPLPPLAEARLVAEGINLCFIAGENDRADPSLIAAQLATLALPPALGPLDLAVRDELASIWGLGFPAAAIRYGFRDFCLEASVAATAAPTPPPLAPRADPAVFAAVPSPAWNGAAAGGGPWNSGSNNTFAGFRTLFHVPVGHQGLVFLFHGTNGGTFFGDSFDTREYINDLVARGFAVVCTESSDRRGGFEQGAQWDKVAVNDDGTPNLANRDYQRMKDLRNWLIANTGIKGGTKLFAMGYSNGAEFAVAFAHLALHEGLPMAGIGLHAVGAGDADVRRAMRRLPPTLPIFWSVLENDHRVPKLAERLDEIRLLRGAAAAPLEDRLGLESKINPLRFERVPGTTTQDATDAFNLLISRGAIDATGARIVASDVFEAKLGGLPSPVPGFAEDVARVAGALHQVSGEFVTDQNDLFDAFAP
jgi:dienelactone hydrolase